MYSRYIFFSIIVSNPHSVSEQREGGDTAAGTEARIQFFFNPVI
jgi:hypothetical protein